MDGNSEVTIFSRDGYMDLVDDAGYASEVAERLGVDRSDIDMGTLYSIAGDDAEACLDEDVSSIDERFEELGAEKLMVRGVSSRWDGASSGYMDPYDSFRDLITDNGYDGIFKDCEIDRIYEEDGSLVVRGFHHDGAVNIEVRGLDGDMLSAFEDLIDGDLDDRKFDDEMARIWDGAIKPDMATHFGIAQKAIYQDAREPEIMGEETIMENRDEAIDQKDGRAERTFVKATFPAAFVHPYQHTDGNGKAWDMAVCTIPPETFAGKGRIDISGFSTTVFLKPFHKERLANDEPVVFGFPEDEKVPLFKNDRETGEHEEMSLDPWALTTALKDSRRAFMERRAAERQVQPPSEMADRARKAASRGDTAAIEGQASKIDGASAPRK